MKNHDRATAAASHLPGVNPSTGILFGSPAFNNKSIAIFSLNPSRDKRMRAVQSLLVVTVTLSQNNAMSLLQYCTASKIERTLQPSRVYAAWRQGTAGESSLNSKCDALCLVFLENFDEGRLRQPYSVLRSFLNSQGVTTQSHLCCMLAVESRRIFGLGAEGCALKAENSQFEFIVAEKTYCALGGRCLAFRASHNPVLLSSGDKVQGSKKKSLSLRVDEISQPH